MGAQRKIPLSKKGVKGRIASLAKIVWPGCVSSQTWGLLASDERPPEENLCA